MIKSKKIVVFFDDICIATKTVEEHIDIIRELLETLARNNVMLLVKKFQLLKKKVDFVGHEVSEEGISITKDQVKAIENYKTPRDFKQLQRFLGLTGYFRKFIKGYKDIVAPLNSIKQDKFYIREEQIKAIKILKEKLISKPLLRIFSPKLEYA